ncbi:head maturation protease, ClpP-related [Sulfitobacter sp.]|uniref:head maturation protease, ClpP-related n=1 Tax=Sulfitobacter sp. TaxID=1903071 RepID=UPI0030036505
MTKRNLPKVDMNARPGVKSDFSQQALSRWNPDVKASVSNEGSISIIDPIGENWYGDGVTAKRIAGALREIGNDDIVVNINSPGGDFFEGLAIYNLLREHSGKVTVKVLGIAASAASVIAMAADEVQIARASFLMIHNTWVCSCGDRHALRDVADWLEPFDNAAVDIYAARTGLPSAELATMCDRETWIGGAAAVEKGFADALLASDEVDSSLSNASLTEVGAQKKLDVALACGHSLPKSERRKLYAALKGGTSRAAPSGTSSAAVETFAALALTKLESL